MAEYKLTEEGRARFESHFTKGDDCWLWHGCRHSQGYGVMGVGGTIDKAHRIAYRLYVGPIPPGMCVCHTCDNPPCVNPAHLFLGTCADNQRDMIAKGRAVHPAGEQRPDAVLTADAVRQIRKLAGAPGVTQRKLAAMFGVSPTIISLVITGKRWKSVPSVG